MPDPSGTVFIVDDDASVRDSTALYLSLRGLQTRQYACGEDFLASLTEDSAGCVLLDIRMNGISGVEVHRQLALSHPQLPVIFMTAHGDVATARQCLKSGALDFIEKPLDLALLMDAITQALKQQASQAAGRLRSRELRDRLQRLTRREQDVLGLLAQGWQNRNIAVELDISPRTVEVYKARLMEKLQARNLADLIRIVLDQAETPAPSSPG